MKYNLQVYLPFALASVQGVDLRLCLLVGAFAFSANMHGSVQSAKGDCRGKCFDIAPLTSKRKRANDRVRMEWNTLGA